MYCLPFEHVGHRRAGLRRRHVDRADFAARSPCRRRAASRRAARRRRREKPPSPAITSVFVTSVPMRRRPPGARNGQALQRRVILDVVRRVAVRDLPERSRPCSDRSRVMRPYGGLMQRQPLHGQRAAGAPPPSPPPRVAGGAAAASLQLACDRRRPPSREPPGVRGPVTALPSMYAMSDWSGYGSDEALADRRCRRRRRCRGCSVSGSNEPPCQFAPPSRLGSISVAERAVHLAHDRRREQRSDLVARHELQRFAPAAPA